MSLVSFYFLYSCPVLSKVGIIVYKRYKHGPTFVSSHVQRPLCCRICPKKLEQIVGCRTSA